MENSTDKASEISEIFLSRRSSDLKVLSGFLVLMLAKVNEALQQDRDRSNENDRRSQIVNTFIQNLETHVEELAAGRAELQMRVSDFAAMQNIHENHLNAVVKAKTGKTTKACIAEKMIAKAQDLLLNTTLSNKEISYCLGFIECSHFSAYFKKYTGSTPQAFRQMHPSWPGRE